MWNLNYGWQVPRPTLCIQFSRTLCRRVHRGCTGFGDHDRCAVRGEYVLEEGTSIAAPYVAGGASDSGRPPEGISISPDLLRLAVARGADLADFSPSEAVRGSRPGTELEILKERPLLPVSLSRECERGLYTGRTSQA
jgi:hypothetical protein